MRSVVEVAAAAPRSRPRARRASSRPTRARRASFRRRRARARHGARHGPPPFERTSRKPPLRPRAFRQFAGLRCVAVQPGRARADASVNERGRVLAARGGVATRTCSSDICLRSALRSSSCRRSRTWANEAGVVGHVRTNASATRAARAPSPATPLAAWHARRCSLRAGSAPRVGSVARKRTQKSWTRTCSSSFVPSAVSAPQSLGSFCERGSVAYARQGRRRMRPPRARAATLVSFRLSEPFLIVALLLRRASLSQDESRARARARAPEPDRFSSTAPYRSRLMRYGGKLTFRISSAAAARGARGSSRLDERERSRTRTNRRRRPTWATNP